MMRGSAAKGLTLSAFLLLTAQGCSTQQIIAPTKGLGVVSVAVVTNTLPPDGELDWPLLLAKAPLTGKHHVLRKKSGPALRSAYYQDRLPPGRYQLIALFKDRYPDQYYEYLPPSLGYFDINAGAISNLGFITHWKTDNGTKTLKNPTTSDNWVTPPKKREAENSTWRGLQKAAAPPLARLSQSAPQLLTTPLGGLSEYWNGRWTHYKTGAKAPLLTAIRLTDGRLLAGGENATLRVSDTMGKNWASLALSPKTSVVLSLSREPGPDNSNTLLMLVSTASALQLLTATDQDLSSWKVISNAGANSGWLKTPTTELRWQSSLSDFQVSDHRGQVLLWHEFR